MKIMLAAFAAILGSGCGLTASGGPEADENVGHAHLAYIMSDTWYRVGEFGFDLSKVTNILRRADLDSHMFKNVVLHDVQEGYIQLDGVTYSVIFGVTADWAWTAPPGSVIWTLNT